MEAKEATRSAPSRTTREDYKATSDPALQEAAFSFPRDNPPNSAMRRAPTRSPEATGALGSHAFRRAPPHRDDR